MNKIIKENIKDLNDRLNNQKAVRVNDGFGTIIYIDKKESKEKAIKKYLKDLEEYKAGAIVFNTLGRAKTKPKENETENESEKQS